MTEHGILFSGEMVRALLANRKTRTRRLSKRWLKVKCGDLLWARETWWEYKSPELHQAAWEVPGSGTRCLFPDGGTHDEPEKEIGGRIWHPSQFPAVWRKRPSIHMPRWASRITLEATADARLERLRDITEDEAICEGLLVQIGGGTGPGAGYKWNGPGYHDFVSVGEFGPTFHVARRHGEFCCCKDGQRLYLTPPRCAFRALWQSLHTKPGERWDDNPEVPVLSFRRLA